MQLRQIYSSKDMNDAICYLMQLKSDNIEAVQKNPYFFARNYLKDMSRTSDEWEMRRKVSHFYSNLGNLLRGKILDKNSIFYIWGPDQFAIIEFLEPIETIIAEKYYGLSVSDEWSALYLLNQGRRWQRKHERKTDPRFVFPIDNDSYKKSLEM